MDVIPCYARNSALCLQCAIDACIDPPRIAVVFAHRPVSVAKYCITKLTMETAGDGKLQHLCYTAHWIVVLRVKPLENMCLVELRLPLDSVRTQNATKHDINIGKCLFCMQRLRVYFFPDLYESLKMPCVCVRDSVTPLAALTASVD